MPCVHEGFRVQVTGKSAFRPQMCLHDLEVRQWTPTPWTYGQAWKLAAVFSESGISTVATAMTAPFLVLLNLLQLPFPGSDHLQHNPKRP